MTYPLFNNHNISDIFAVCPTDEMFAFEKFWLEDTKSSFKRIAEKFHDTYTMSLTNLNPNVDFSDIKSDFKQALEKSNITDYGVKLSGTYDFPKNLYDAKYPIPLLYYQGDWNLIYNKSIAIVGTRKPSFEGIKRTRKLVKLLAENGYTIVSGLAEGIDTVAHKTALEIGASTIAVIGTPINRFYPKQNEGLQRKIAAQQLLISQVPILRYAKQPPKANRFFFPERNATMSAITKGSIIVEAGQTSGTLVQARHAIFQKRKLFVLNNCFEDPNLTWPEKFAKKGAIRVQNFDDIINALETQK